MTKRCCWQVELRRHNVYSAQRLDLLITARSAAIAEKRAIQIGRMIAEKDQTDQGEYVVESLSNHSSVYCF